MADDGDVDTGFIRQRRNLILISLGLLASLHYGLTFEKINILGNETALPGSQPVAGLLWWFWAYLLWRYWTAFMEIEDRGISTTYDRLHFSLLRRWAKRWWMKHCKPDLPPNVHYDDAQPRDIRDYRHLVLSHSIPGPTRDDPQIYGKTPWTVPRLVYAWCIFAAAFLLVGRTSKISEFVIPFVAAATPVAYWAWLRF